MTDNNEIEAVARDLYPSVFIKKPPSPFYAIQPKGTTSEERQAKWDAIQAEKQAKMFKVVERFIKALDAHRSKTND